MVDNEGVMHLNRMHVEDAFLWELTLQKMYLSEKNNKESICMTLRYECKPESYFGEYIIDVVWINNPAYSVVHSKYKTLKAAIQAFDNFIAIFAMSDIFESSEDHSFDELPEPVFFGEEEMAFRKV